MSYLEENEGLDRLTAPVQRAARLLPPGRARDALHGVWHDLIPAAELGELTDSKPAKRMIGDVPVVVVRDRDGVHVLADRCSHLSGPLSDGDCRDGALTCPWHGSTFRIADGSVARPHERAAAGVPHPPRRRNAAGLPARRGLKPAGRRRR